MIHIVLHHPEIPQNTGNIARTCAATGAHLHLIKPLGFEIDSAKLKRAGLDYWDKLDITYYDGDEDFFAQHRGDTVFFYSSKAPRSYTAVSYPDDVYLMFGCETKGLPEELLAKNEQTCVRIPMRGGLRCLNLSNAVAVAVYEVLRTRNFDMLEEAGTPTTFDWN